MISPLYCFGKTERRFSMRDFTDFAEGEEEEEEEEEDGSERRRTRRIAYVAKEEKTHSEIACAFEGICGHGWRVSPCFFVCLN